MFRAIINFDLAFHLSEKGCIVSLQSICLLAEYVIWYRRIRIDARLFWEMPIHENRIGRKNMKRKERLLSLLLALAMVLSLLPVGAMANDRLSSGTVSIVDHGSQTTRTTERWYYNDAWFLNSSYEENPHLATLSGIASAAATAGQGDTTGQSAIALLEDLGFRDPETNDYFAKGLTLPDSVGCVLGHKTLIDGNRTCTLLAVLPRSGGYGSEWAGNFNVGTAGIHQGFLLARDEVLRFMRQYVEEYDIAGPLKIWVAGYSRGAAVADLLGGFLADDGGAYLGCTLAPEDLFVYNIATPATIPAQGLALSAALTVSAARADEPYASADTAGQTRSSQQAGTVTPSSEQYGGIYNYVAVGDVVPKLPPEVSWQMSRYGAVTTIDQAEPQAVEWLRLQNPVLREDFPKGGYGVPLPYMTLDVATLSIVPDQTREGISIDALEDSRVANLVRISGDRSGFVSSGLQEIVGSLLVALDADLPEYEALLEAAGGTEALIKAGVLNVLALAVEELQAENPELTEEDALAIVAAQILSFLSGQEVDPDTFTAADAFALVVNLLLASENGEDSLLETIAAMLPEETGALLTEFAAWSAQQEGDIPADPDALLACLAAFFVENKDLPAVQELVSDLADMLIEKGFDGMIVGLFAAYEEGQVLNDLEGKEQVEAAIWILITSCVNGLKLLYDPEYPLPDEERIQPAEELRGFVTMVILPAVLPKDADALKSLFTGWEYFAQQPGTFAPLVGDLVGLVLPEGVSSVAKGADQTLADLAESVAEVSQVPASWETLRQNPAQLRHALSAVLFTPRESYSFADDLEDGATMITYLNAIILSHYYETYIAWLKSQDSNYVLPGKGRGGGGAAAADNPITVPSASAGASVHGSVKVSADKAKAGARVTITPQPDTGYQTADVTVTDQNGKEVPVTKNADGTYSFIMPDTAVTITPAFEKADEPDTPGGVDVSDRFKDVKRDAWYHDPVQWVVGKGLMQGVSEDRFAPQDVTTRAMVVTMLWRMAGEPSGSPAAPFTDVKAGSWYADAVNWAAATGAVSGTSATTFSPKDPVTREQLAAILYRYAQAQGKGFTGAWAFPLNYPDADRVSQYAYEPLCWMTMNGIITGMGDGALAPRDNATRAQIAAIFMRFAEALEK